MLRRQQGKMNGPSNDHQSAGEVLSRYLSIQLEHPDVG